ncbi:MAG: peptidase, partial [Rhodothermales bacterium]|nr:peptidase [Rhodothermales bacterium]
RDRWTVTTRCCLDAGIPIRDLGDLRNGQAVAADITGERLASAGFDASPVTEDEAATSLVELSRFHRLTVFEYFMTDKVGHSRSFDDARTVLMSLDRFLGTLTTESRRAEITLLVTSDHGNMEDLSRKTHTRNPVPFIAVGPAAPLFGDVASILDVTPAIVAALSDRL